MTNPQGPPNEGPPTWARPGGRDPFSPPPQRSSEPQGGPSADAPTEAGALPQATEQISAPTAAGAATRQPGHPPPPTPPALPSRRPAAPDEEPAPAKKKRRFLRDPLSIMLVVIIVIALLFSAVIGGELYARHAAENTVARVVACEVKDQATARFGVAPLLLYQLATQHFTNISVETAGNQIREFKGAKLQFTLQNVQLRDTPTSQGTVGALDATITWSSDGIRQWIQNAIPVLGAFVTSSVITHPTDGTIELKGMLNDLTLKPAIASDGNLELQIITFNTLGFSVPKETVQTTLNDYISNLTKQLPLGIKADNTEVTTSGVGVHLATRNADLPGGGTGGGQNQDPCFADL